MKRYSLKDKKILQTVHGVRVPPGKESIYIPDGWLDWLWKTLKNEHNLEFPIQENSSNEN